MNTLLFHNNVYLNDGHETRKIDKGAGLKTLLEKIDKVRICLVDADIELASAPQAQIEKKDSMLARKFTKLHPANAYILQDEKIDENIFQVIGIKAEKISEIYGWIPSSKVEVFVPYGMALRQFLLAKDIDLTRGIIFIDDLGDEKLITVFSNQKFSVTRALLINEMENILPEIKRSQIGFGKKLEEFDNWKLFDSTVLTNSKPIANYLLGADKNLNVAYMDVPYPALEGLKVIDSIDTMVKFLLPQDIKDRKIKQDLRTRLVWISISLVILSSGLGFAFINKIKLAFISHEHTLLNRNNRILADQLADLDLKTYREDLRKQKSLNYATPYFKILNILPISYGFDSFHYFLTGHWNLDAYISSKEGESFDEIPRLNILKNAAINDCLIKDKPGKHIQIEL